MTAALLAIVVPLAALVMVGCIVWAICSDAISEMNHPIHDIVGAAALVTVVAALAIPLIQIFAARIG